LIIRVGVARVRVLGDSVTSGGSVGLVLKVWNGFCSAWVWGKAGFFLGGERKLVVVPIVAFLVIVGGTTGLGISNQIKND
jgi:hypothetical protein